MFDTLGVSLPGGACTLILTTFSVYSPQAQPPAPQSVVAVAPAITQLSCEGLSHYNAITHSFHPQSQPASQPAKLPSPSLLPISSLLCDALAPLPFIFQHTLTLAHLLHLPSLPDVSPPLIYTF